MSSLGSITRIVNQLQLGDRDTAQQLWERYFRRLVGLARKKLGDLPRHAPVDAEDVALNAFDSFLRRAEQGQYPQLADRDGLWEMLMLITARKAYDEHQYWSRDKRDWRRVLQEAANPGAEAKWDESPLAAVLSQEPDPAFATEIGEKVEGLLADLGDKELRVIAIYKMEGYTNAEIAAEIGKGLSTVEARLRKIRKKWAIYLPNEADGEPA